MIKPEVRSFFHADSNTITHVVTAPGSKRCAIIDAALEHYNAEGRVQRRPIGNAKTEAIFTITTDKLGSSSITRKIDAPPMPSSFLKTTFLC